MNEKSKKLDQEEMISLLRLYKIPRISTLKALMLIKKWGSATAIFNSKDEFLSSDRYGLGADFFSRKYLEEAIRALEMTKKMKYSLMGYGMSNYPALLKECEDAPLVLMSSGSIDWKSPRWIAVVGTRSASKAALAWTRQFIEELSDYNPTIVSGLAYGIDIKAHQSALECRLQTIACLGHGLNSTYPKSHRRVREAMELKGGMISEFMPEESPRPYRFVQRNRIIAGLTRAVIVVESPSKGGSLITAELANSYQREVFAFPNRISDSHQGCNQLIRDCKAQLLSSSRDLIDFMGWD